MSICVLDSFTDSPGTLLTNHTGEVGANWVLGPFYPGSAVPVIDATGERITGGTGAASLVFASGIAATDEEYGECIFDALSANPGFGVWVRSFPNPNSAYGYMGYFNAGTVKILRLNGTSFTQIGGIANVDIPVSSDNIARILATGLGASVRLDVYFNGVLVVTGTDVSNERLAAPAGTATYVEGAGTQTQGAHIKLVRLIDKVGSTNFAAKVTIPLLLLGGDAAANLSGLKWAWHDQATPDLFEGPPTDFGNAEVSNVSGMVVIELPNSLKTASGQIGHIGLTNSDGDPSSTYLAFAGPWAVD